MPFYSPVRGFRGTNGGISWSPSSAYVDVQVEVPCGQCVGCRLERARQWSIRMMHEAALHDENAFVTLTYDDYFLPRDGSLVKKHFQDFVKRLRRRFKDRRISYFHCGEYGEQNGRPHYHAVLFNVGFPDRVKWSVNGRGDDIFTSPTLASLWPLGLATIGEVTRESAGYVARYCLKKVTGQLAEDHYRRVHPDTGEIYYLQPEYATMSLRPAIGQRWYEEYGKEVRQHDSVVMRGRGMYPPRFYDKLHEELDKDAHELVKNERQARARARKADSTPERLAIREKVKKAQVSSLRRSL